MDSYQEGFLAPLPGRSSLKSRHTKYPSQTHLPHIYFICHLPLIFLSPTSPLLFYSPSRSQSPPLFFTCLFPLLVCLLICLVVMASSLSAPMSPEFEVLHFKQRQGENLKDAWHRICSAQYKSSRKLSTSVLLRNFCVGITPWNRCILDIATGGDFMSSHTLMLIMPCWICLALHLFWSTELF